jgi:hypothetical protein
VKHDRRGKRLGIMRRRTPFPTRPFSVRMNGQPWPEDGRPVSLTRLLTALRKSLVKTLRVFARRSAKNPVLLANRCLPLRVAAF